MAVRALDEQTARCAGALVAPATQRVTLRAVERATGRPVAGQAARPRRSGRVPGAGGPPSHPQPGLVRGLFGGFRPSPLGRGARPCLHLHHRRDDGRPAAGPGLRRGLQGLRDPPGAHRVHGRPRHRRDHRRAGEGAALARAGLGDRRHARPLPLAAQRPAGRRGRGRERHQPAGQPVGRADDQRGRLRRQDHLGLAGGRRRRRVPGARGHREPPARPGPHLAAGLQRPDHRAHDHRRPGRIGPGRPDRDPADRMGAAVQAAGRPGRAAALPQPARRARRQHRQRRDRRRRDDTSWDDLYSGIRPLLALRLVPLPELRLPGGGGGRHRQDVGHHRRRHGAHLRAHSARPALHLRGLDGCRAPRRDLRHLRPAARVRRGRQADGQPHRSCLRAAARWM